MKFGIVTFPGSNCDYDAYHAVAEILGEEAVYLWHKDHDLQGSDVIILPGGFSYGDYLRAGAIARFSPIMREVVRTPSAADRCSGSATAFRSPARPDCSRARCCATRRSSSSARPLGCGWRRTRRCSPPRTSPASASCSRSRTATDATAPTTRRSTAWRARGGSCFRYAPDALEANEAYNPNGSMRDIAGIINSAGNVLGMMPHPERAVDPLLGPADGLPLFESILQRVAV